MTRVISFVLTLVQIVIQTEEQKAVLVKTFDDKEKNYLAEIENLKKLLRECMEREEKLRKGMLTMERQGFLVKKGNSGGKMQKRWFVLRGEYLLYFKGKDAQVHFQALMCHLDSC